MISINDFKLDKIFQQQYNLVLQMYFIIKGLSYCKHSHTETTFQAMKKVENDSRELVCCRKFDMSPVDPF